MKTDIELTLRSIPHNIHHVNRYVSLCGADYTTYSGSSELHHILPKSIFPQFKDDPNNLVRVPSRFHFILHWCLSNCFVGRNSYKMRFAFSLMTTAGKNHSRYKSSIGYEFARKKLKGATMSQKTKEKLSKIRKGTVIVRYLDGTIKRVRTDSLDYINGTCIPATTGRTHSELTKQKIGDGNRAATRVIRDGAPKYVKSILPTDEINNDDISKKASDRFVNSYHYYNKETNESKRIKGNDIPEGFIRMRKFVNPFSGIKFLKNTITGKIIQTTEALDWCVSTFTKDVIVNHIDKIVFGNRKSFSLYYGIGMDSGITFRDDKPIHKKIKNKFPPDCVLYKDADIKKELTTRMKELYETEYTWITLK
jgi:hypothetical protein